MNYAKKIIVRAEERVCIIRTRDGRESVHRGAEVPSVTAVLLFYKRRKLREAQERNRSPQDRKQHMARDLRDRLGKRGAANFSIDPTPVHWWEKGGAVRM
ncbi:hypothetical protein V1282_000888 [Nitrobacteraceae bacterium AZCC 2146]